MIPCGCSFKPILSVLQNEIKISRILSEEDSSFVRWVKEYAGKDTNFIWTCSNGHQVKTSVHNFLISRVRCARCWLESPRHPSNRKGFYPTQLDRVDTLYLVNIGLGYCLKVGRTFKDLGNQRYQQIRLGMGGRTVNKIMILEGNHQLIFHIEQMIVKASSKFRHFDHEYSNELLQYSELQHVQTYLEELVTIYAGEITVRYH